MFKAIFGICFYLFSSFAAADVPDFSGLVEDLKEAVVNIKATREIKKNPANPNYGKGDISEELLRQFFGRQPYRSRPRPSAGSGFIIGSDGYILTNNHVVEGADEIIVALSDRRERVAEVIGQDPLSDLALLKVEATGLPSVNLGSSEDLRAGTWVIAIGSPFGFEHSVTAGIVSATGRNLPGGEARYVPFIQTDVAINPGNSGGPLIDLNGKVVGINSQIFTRSGGFMGLSFAIPIDVAMEVVEQLKNYGAVVRGWLGVGYQNLDMDLAESFGLDRPSGALVTDVIPESPAEKAGVLAGDVILSFDGREVDLSSDLPHMVGRFKVGSLAQLEVFRDGKKKIIGVTIGERDVPKRGGPILSQKGNRLGIEVEDLEEEDVLNRLGLQGVLVSKVYPGVAQRKGIRAGDIIREVASKKIRNVSQFTQLISSLPEGKIVRLLVLRGEASQFITLELP